MASIKRGGGGFLRGDFRLTLTFQGSEGTITGFPSIHKRNFHIRVLRIHHYIGLSHDTTIIVLPEG